MKTRTAVIDKSLLHEICKQPEKERDRCFELLLKRYALVIPAVLVEEVWVEWSHPDRKREPFAENLVHCLLELRNTWIAEPIEIAFQELVNHQPISMLPKPSPQLLGSFDSLDNCDPELVRWMTERRLSRERHVENRVAQQQRRSIDIRDVTFERPGQVLRQVVLPQIEGILRDREERAKLLDGLLGQGFRATHPEASSEIEVGLARFQAETMHQYRVTQDLIATAMAYFYSPLCQIRDPNTFQTRSLVKPSKKAQRNSLADERYVQSALLTGGLLTRDRDMAAIATIFEDAGWWAGHVVFFDPRVPLRESMEVTLASVERGLV